MNETDSLTWVRSIQDMFFEAMLAGYASDAAHTELPGFPHSKSHTYETENTWGKWFTVDYWVTNHRSEHTVGRTLIYRDSEPVWHMTYEGSYSEEVIPFLKRALLEHYTKGIFLGCRGPRQFVDQANGWEYQNSTASGQNFSDFNGSEQIMRLPVKEHPTCIGWHSFQGFLIAPLV